MKIVGLTGSSGSGKTSAAKIFIKYGFYHLDCDKLVHNSVYKDPRVISALSLAFGKAIIENNASVNTKKLADIVFNSDDMYNLLIATVNPFILEYIAREIKSCTAEYLLLDAPQLFESGIFKDCDFTVAVVCDTDISVERICKRDGITRQKAIARLKKQKPVKFYIDNCDYVIYNNKDIKYLTDNTLDVIRQITGGAND